MLYEASSNVRLSQVIIMILMQCYTKSDFVMIKDISLNCNNFLYCLVFTMNLFVNIV